MCGIVGYTGPRQAYPIVVKGLKRLEYRGYDSAGVALVNGDLKVFKGNSFTCRFHVPPMLPWMPALDSTDNTGKATLAQWVQVLIRRHGSNNPPYTDMASGLSSIAVNAPCTSILRIAILPADSIASMSRNGVA